MIGVLLVLIYFGMALLAAAVLLQPDRFTVSRSLVVAAPPAEVFSRINELRNWEAWSPWAKLDPDAERNYEGPQAGAGASVAWSGGETAGVGRMTIVESRPYESIELKLDMRRRFVGSNDVSFRLIPEEGGTRVVWTISGRSGLAVKFSNLVGIWDKIVGGEFERGLANLNASLAKG
jgi:carbon monoxide dehydrogenase subunit G